MRQGSGIGLGMSIVRVLIHAQFRRIASRAALPCMALRRACTAEAGRGALLR
jgi:hypothetical protein